MGFETNQQRTDAAHPNLRHPVGLVVLPRAPQPASGTGQRSLIFLEAAARLGPVHVVLLDGGVGSDLGSLPGVKGVHRLESAKITPKTRLAQRFLGPWRLIWPRSAYALDPSLRQALRALADETGATYLLFRYARLFCVAGLARDQGLALCVDVDDRDDQKYASRIERLRRPLLMALAQPFLNRLKRYLGHRLGTAHHVWFAGKDDLMPLPAPTETSVRPNVPFEAPSTPPAFDLESQVVLFVGTFVHAPNPDGVRWFLDTAWDAIKTQAPKAELRVVGFGPWARLADAYAHMSDVSFIGAVDDLTAEYARAALVICPLREGGGSKIKLIEAAAFGRPIVATSFSLRGFDVALPELITPADTGPDMAAACLHHLTNPAHAQKQGEALRHAQETHYTRAAVCDRIAQDITRALTQKEARTS